MSWAKIDDQLHGHRKIQRAWKCRAALGLHLMALSYSACYEPKGFVSEEFVEEKLPNARERATVLRALTDAPAGFDHGLWEPAEGGWNIHDWDEYNGDAKTREEVRAAKSAAGKKGAAARWGAKTADGERMAEPMAPAIPPANGTGMAPSPSPTHKATAMSDEPDGERANAHRKAAAEQRVFDRWIEATGKTGATVFAAKRRRLIANALKLYPLDDVLDAVQGWRHSPHHRGENDSHTVYNDLELLLRDAQHIERFRDLNRRRNGAAPRGDGFGERLKARTIG